MTREKLRDLAKRAFVAGESAARLSFSQRERAFEEFWFQEFPPRLSSPQARMLEDVAESGNPWARVRGQSAHGGADGTIRSLGEHGLRLIRFDQDRSKWFVTERGKLLVLMLAAR